MLYFSDQIKDYRQKVKKLRDLNQAVSDENLKLAERGSSNSRFDFFLYKFSYVFSSVKFFYLLLIRSRFACQDCVEWNSFDSFSFFRETILCTLLHFCFSPSQTKYKPGASVYDSEIQAVKRAQVVQQVIWTLFFKTNKRTACNGQHAFAMLV